MKPQFMGNAERVCFIVSVRMTVVTACSARCTLPLLDSCHVAVLCKVHSRSP